MKYILILLVIVALALICISGNGEVQGTEIRRSSEAKKWMKYHGTNSAYINWETRKWVFKRDGKVCNLIPKGE